METELLQDIRAANLAITRFVSGLSAAKASPRPDWHSIHLDSLTAQLKKVERDLGVLPPPGLRDAELAEELQKYAVNLGLIKAAIEELGPVLEKRMRLIKEELAHLSAAQSWSDSLSDLSK